jgi:lipopolysaccharide cholinephosphotransferase
MKQISTLQELHILELNMLDAIDNICKKYHLRYFLAGGTLLGAVRHGGFIPWDDDVDISMPRNDYEKFLEIMEQGEKEFPEYKVFQIHEKGDYCFPFAKFIDTRTIMKEHDQGLNVRNMGLFIDIFPIDGFGDDLEKAKAMIIKQSKIGGRIAVSFSNSKGFTFYRKCTLLVWKVKYFLKGKEKSYRSLVNELSKYDFDKSQFVGSTFGLRGTREIIKQEHFAKSIKMNFENRKYSVPIGYDQYLKQMYGDYMELPPEEERIEPHGFEFYLKEE